MASSVWIDMFGPHSYDGSTTTFTGNVQVTGQFIGPAADNTAAPPFSFLGDLNTGLGSAAADTLNLITGGTSRVAVSTTAVTSTLPYVGPAGTKASPTFRGTDADSGLYFVADNVVYSSDSQARVRLGGDTVALASTQSLGWASGDPVDTSNDTVLSRGAAGRVDTTKAFRMTPVAFAALPTAAEGAIASVNDSNTATWGATIAGGGANKVLAYYNGANWTVAGA